MKKLGKQRTSTAVRNVKNYAFEYFLKEYFNTGVRQMMKSRIASLKGWSSALELLKKLDMVRGGYGLNNVMVLDQSLDTVDLGGLFEPQWFHDSKCLTFKLNCMNCRIVCPNQSLFTLSLRRQEASGQEQDWLKCQPSQSLQALPGKGHCPCHCHALNMVRQLKQGTNGVLLSHGQRL